MPTSPFGLSENPFVEGHDARFVYPSRAHREVVARLRRGIENREPFALVTGLPGVGKTIAVQAALAETEPHTLVLIAASPSLSHAKFRERVLAGFAPDALDPAAPARSADGIEARLRAVRACGRIAFLVVDEAQNLGLPLLEDLRVLSDLEADGRNLLQVILVGQPRFEEDLSRPGCEALLQRIAVRCRLGPLSAEETARYIRHRVSVAGGDAQSLFTNESCQTVHRLSHGIPREINLLAGEALMLAHAAGESAIAAGHVAGAAVLLGFRSVVKDSQPAGDAVQPVAMENVEVVPGADADPGHREGEEPGAGLSIMRNISLPPSCEQPLVRDAEEPPLVRSEISLPAPSGDPPSASLRPVGPAARVAPARREGPEVDAWLARFRDPAGPPRIGSRLVVATTAAVALRPRTTVTSHEQPALAAPAPHLESRPSVLPRRRSRRGSQVWKTATWTAGALLLMATAGLVLVNSSRDLMRWRPSARAAIATTARKVERTRVLSAPVAQPSLRPASPTVAPARPSAPAASVSSPALKETRRAPAPPARAYGVEVATFIIEDRAVEERDRLAARISLPCRIVNSGEDGYAIVVGPVASVQEAERLSVDLSQRRLVGQARVVRWAVSDTSGR